MLCQIIRRKIMHQTQRTRQMHLMQETHQIQGMHLTHQEATQKIVQTAHLIHQRAALTIIQTVIQTAILMRTTHQRIKQNNFSKKPILMGFFAYNLIICIMDV